MMTVDEKIDFGQELYNQMAEKNLTVNDVMVYCITWITASFRDAHTPRRMAPTIVAKVASHLAGVLDDVLEENPEPEEGGEK